MIRRVCGDGQPASLYASSAQGAPFAMHAPPPPCAQKPQPCAAGAPQSPCSHGGEAERALAWQHQESTAPGPAAAAGSRTCIAPSPRPAPHIRAHGQRYQAGGGRAHRGQAGRAGGHAGGRAGAGQRDGRRGGLCRAERAAQRAQRQHHARQAAQQQPPAATRAWSGVAGSTHLRSQAAAVQAAVLTSAASWAHVASRRLSPADSRMADIHMQRHPRQRFGHLRLIPSSTCARSGRWPACRQRCPAR